MHPTFKIKRTITAAYLPHFSFSHPNITNLSTHKKTAAYLPYFHHICVLQGCVLGVVLVRVSFSLFFPGGLFLFLVHLFLLFLSHLFSLSLANDILLDGGGRAPHLLVAQRMVRERRRLSLSSCASSCFVRFILSSALLLRTFATFAFFEGAWNLNSMQNTIFT